MLPKTSLFHTITSLVKILMLPFKALSSSQESLTKPLETGGETSKQVENGKVERGMKGGGIKVEKNRAMIRMSVGQMMHSSFRIQIPSINIGKPSIKPFLDEMTHLALIYPGKFWSMKA